MKTVWMLFFGMFLTVLLSAGSGSAVQQKTIALPAPSMSGGKPLMEALALRQSDRTFSDRSISEQDLSNLLWAVWGVNRPDKGLRTAPTARNEQDLAVYAVLATGVWLYDGRDHQLLPALDQDVRGKFGGWPLTLVYAAPADSPFSALHLGSLYQNAGLYCASAGLNNLVKGSEAKALDGLLALPDGYRVFVVQSIGYPE